MHHHILSLAFLASVALASPVPNSEVAVYKGDTLSPRSFDLARRYECSVVNDIVEVIGTSRSKVVYTVAARVTALSVCQLLHNHGIGGIGTDDCYPIANLITAGLVVVFHATGTSSEAAPEEDTDKRRSVPLLADHLAAVFSAEHMSEYSYDAIAALPPSDDGDIKHHAIITGVRHGNTTVDMVFADFGSGNGHIRIQAPGSGSSSNLSKRHNGPGFKISYTSRRPSLLTQAHQQQASSALAHDWANRANTRGIGDYTGFQETDHNANFYYRIISEVDSFGSNFEDVNVPCGQMAQYL